MNDTLADDILTVQSLTERLKKGEDVTSEEAQFIASYLVEEKSSILDPTSRVFNRDLFFAFIEWFRAVESRLPAHGNFVSTIWLESDGYNLDIDWFQYIREGAVIPIVSRLSQNLYDDPAEEVFPSLPGLVRQCRAKLLFPDGVYKIEYLIPEEGGNKFKVDYFDWAGEMRSTPFFKEIKKMKKFPVDFVFSIRDCFRYAPDDASPEDFLYYASIVRNMPCPLIQVYSCYLHTIPLIYASDFEKYPYLSYITEKMKKDPNEIIRWACNAGYIDGEKAKDFLSGNRWALYGDSFNLKKVCDGFAEYCRERYIRDKINETLEDGSWTDVIR